MTGLGWDVYADRRIFGDDIVVFLHRARGDEREVLQYPLPSVVAINVNAPADDPTFRLDMATARRLMTALWGEGIRPMDVTQFPEAVAGELTATKYHLEDMRRLALGKK
jgi:hypothetical protein